MGNYKIEKLGIDKKPQEYINVTGITGLISKGDSLIQWGVDQAVDCLIEWQNKLEHGDFIDYDVFDKARITWKQTRNKTADIGSELHKLCETFINVKLKNGDLLSFMVYINSQSYQLKQMFYQFYIWQKKNVKQFLESEKPVCHQELSYGGTHDFSYINHQNKICMRDIKTTSYKPYKNKQGNINYKLNSVYDEHKIQVCSYAQARESMEGKYKVFNSYNGNQWQKIYNYDKIKFDEVGILNIERDYFNLTDCIIKPEDVKHYQYSFNGLLQYYYGSAKRRIQNKRAKDRI